MATHSSILAWEPGGLQSLGCKRARHDLMTKTITKYRLQSRYFLLESRVKQAGKSESVVFVCMPAESLQSCPTPCDPMDYSPPGSSVHRILRPEYWSGLPCPSAGDLPNPGIKPASHVSCSGRRVLYH